MISAGPAADSFTGTPDSREVRVFLSSTFRDFNEERKLLATRVFPYLNRRARERGVELVEVDLRWGVTQEQAEDGHALEICLKQIERCKPFFIGMLGDSYGSLTPPQRQLLQGAPELLAQRPWLDGRIGEASYTELEIEHSLQLLRDPKLVGQAFFYFRDPAYSKPKADAGEPGWRSDAPADCQKLELLRSKIRSSGYPLVEGLKDPEAIAERIKADLWALIDSRFPEGEQPDALAKEEHKHADYRRSRTREGQYIGGKGYIDKLECWLAEGKQQILITGESGAGKSALIANWMAAHQQSHPTDGLYAHHLGCTNDANALRPLLGRLIDTASRELLAAGVIQEALAVPENWWELVAKVAESLETISLWCEEQGNRWIWVLDGLDRLDLEDQKALPWLPQNLPARIHVVASALKCRAREILNERGYTTLIIEALAQEEQGLLIQNYLGRYSRELEGGLRDQITAHPLAGSPLFLKVLLEELRQCGRYETLKTQLDFYLSSQTTDDLYERVLERLESDGNGDSVRKVMTALWASRAGLSEPELLAITGLVPLQWAPIDLALEKAFGRNGNRLVFDHDYLRIAVEDRYLPSEEARRQAHSDLADWYQAREGWDERNSEELPWQLQEAGLLGDLRDWLLMPGILANLQWDRGGRETINYWQIARAKEDGELDELIAEAVEDEIEKRREDADDLIWFVDRLAGLLSEAGLYRELLLRLRALSLELEEASEDRDEESMLSSLQWLADAHGDRANYQEAEQLYQRCLEARERLLGPEHPSTLTTVNNLGLLYSDKGDYEQAEALYLRALEASERLLGPEHPDTLTTVGNLGLLYSDKGDYEQAEGLYLRALEAKERLLGPEHPDTLTTVNNLAGLYQDKGDYEQAEALFLRALEARERLLGPEHPDTNGTRYWLAKLLSEQGRYSESITLRRQELAVAAQRDGRDASGTLTSIHDLADDLYWNDDLQEAEQLYREALAGWMAVLGDDDSGTMASRYGLARCLSAQERHGEAIELRRVELKWCRKQNGYQDEGTLTSINELAIDLRECGMLDEAESLFRELLASRVAVLEPEDFLISCSLGGLSKTLEQAGKLEDALDYAQQCLAHRLEHEGTDSWYTNNDRLDLARVLYKLCRSAEALALLDELQISVGENKETDDNDRQLLANSAELRQLMKTS